MTKQLVSPLGSYADRDEFQIGSMLVFVRYDSNSDHAGQLAKAERKLPALQADRPAVEELVTNSIGSSVVGTVVGINIESDGSAEYDCTFFGGEYEDELFVVFRDTDGRLFFKTKP